MQIGTKIFIDEINIKDVRSICLEIAKRDKSAYKLFKKDELKNKYTEDINKMVDEWEIAMNTGNSEEIYNVHQKYSHIIDRYLKLNPNINIVTPIEEKRKSFILEETDGNSHILSLKDMYDYSKINSCIELEREKMNLKSEKNLQEVYDKSERIIGVILSEEKELENINKDTDKFRNEIEGMVQEIESETIENNDDGYIKQQDDINGEVR